MKVSLGRAMLPTILKRFFPSACCSSSFRRLCISPPDFWNGKFVNLTLKERIVWPQDVWNGTFTFVHIKIRAEGRTCGRLKTAKKWLKFRIQDIHRSRYLLKSCEIIIFFIDVKINGIMYLFMKFPFISYSAQISQWNKYPTNRIPICKIIRN